MSLHKSSMIRPFIVLVFFYMLLIISLPLNAQSNLDFFKQPEKQPTTWVDTLPPIFHDQNGYKYYTEWNYITYGWCLVFTVAFISTAIVLYRKGFRAPKSYCKYQLIWKITAALSSLLTFFLWRINPLPTGASIHSFSPFLLFLLAFIFPGILLLITVSPVIIQRYYQNKRSAS